MGALKSAIELVILYPVYALIILLVVIALIRIIYGLIKNSKKERNIFKKIDISDSKMNTIITMLSTYKGYYRLLTKNNLIIFITEYAIYMGFIIDEVGTVVGEENSDYWILKSTGSDTRISNKMFLFNDIKKKLKERLGNKEIKEYIIMGGNCIFLVKLVSAKILRMNNVFVTFTKTEMKKVYTEEEIDAMADSLNQIM